MATRPKSKHNKPACRRRLDDFEYKMLNIDEIQLKINDTFIIRRFEKIDWKQIASVNVEQLKTNPDWNVIEKNFSNILCCHLESEFNQSSLDPNLCKLFQLAQISIDYLLQIREHMASKLKTCQDQIQNQSSLLDATVKAREQTEKKLKELKKESRKSINKQPYYRCPVCPKTFLNGDFLIGHWQRRHPEYVTTSPSIPSPSIQHQPTNLKPDFRDATSNEITDLKIRLQSAEKQLENEQKLLHSIIEKMDKSSANLEGMLAQEVEKIRTVLHEELKDSYSEVPNSPQKEKASISIQTSPRMVEPVIAPSPAELDVQVVDNPSTNGAHIEEKVVLVTPSPSTRSIYTNKEPVKLIPQAINSQPDDDSLTSDSSTSSSEDSSPVIEKEMVLDKVNRQLLLDRFKSTIQNALKQRMRMLGIDTHKKALSDGTFRLLSEKIKADQSAELLAMRQHFETQLKERSGKSKSPISRSGKSLRPLLTRRKESTHSKKKFETSKKPPQEEPVAKPLAQPVTARAPVPTPRQRNYQTVTSTPMAFMARDGELVSEIQGFTCDTVENQKVEEKEPSHVPVCDVIQKPAKGNESQEDDSFSLSSLDAILSELKKPNRFGAPTPPSTKSVQWRVPVETIEKADSWDS